MFYILNTFYRERVRLKEGLSTIALLAVAARKEGGVLLQSKIDHFSISQHLLPRCKAAKNYVREN